MRFRFSIFLLLVCASFAKALPLYSIIDLGDFVGGADQSQAYAINASGQVTGRGEIANGGRAFLAMTDANGATTLTDLGNLPALSRATARSINARGQVVGLCTDGDKSRAFLWSPTMPNESSGAMVEVTGLPGERNTGNATGINGKGQVVGYTSPTAFLWTPSTPNGTSGSAIDLGSLPNDTRSFALGINDAGQVVGSSASVSVSHAFLWTPTIANSSSGAMIDLGFLPGGSGLSQATALNNAGEVVGTGAAANGQHAFLWLPDGNGMRDLGDFAGGSDFSAAFAINNARQVVGNGNGNDGDHAFLWTETDGLVDLNTLFESTTATWTLRYAQGITDNGQITGWGEVDPDGAGPLPVATHAFRLRRIAEINPNELYASESQPNEITLRFVGRTGASYQLEGTAALSSVWQAIGNPIVGEGGLVTIARLSNGPRFFYRVSQLN